MSRLDEFFRAAEEAIWACRLAESRIRTPVEPGSMARYRPMGPRNAPWKFDYYNHMFASKRLLESAEAINEILSDPGLAAELNSFRSQWQTLRPLRDVLQHPRSTIIKWRSVDAFYDRIEYRPISGAEPQWRFTLDELHDSAESLWAAVEAASI